MAEFLKKTLVFLSFAWGMIFFAASDSCAQLLDKMTAEQFASSHGGGDYASILHEDSNQIICGNKDDVCSKDETCLRCKYTFTDRALFWDVSSHISNKSKCVPKSGFDASRLQEYWPECKTIDRNIDITIAGTRETRELIHEPNGFLNDDQTDILFITVNKEKHTFRDADGNEYEIYVSDSTPTVTYAENNFKNCEVMPVKLHRMQRCFFCPLSNLIFEAVNDITAASFASFGLSFQKVMIIIWALWLALVSLQQVFPMTKQDASKFLTALIKQSFKFLFAYFLLVYYADLFRYFIVPLLDAGLQLGTKIQTVRLSEIDRELLGVSTASDISKTFFNISLRDGSPTLYERIELYLATLQLKLAYMQVIGTTLFCVGSQNMFNFYWDKAKIIEDLKAGFKMLMIGGILTVFGLILTVAFAFYFLDAILQLAVIGAMLPFMIAGWPFKITAQYAATGFKMLLNTFFVLFFTGFVISVNIELINQSLSLSQGASHEITAGFDAIVLAVNEQNYEAIKDATDLGGTGFLLLIFACIFGFKFVAQTAPLAATLSSGGFGRGGIAGKIGTMAASNAKGLATKATGLGRKGAAYAGRGAVAKTVGGIGRMLQSGGEKLGKSTSKFTQKMGRGIGRVGRNLQEGAAKSKLKD